MITISIVTYKTNLKELEECFACLSSSLIDRIYIVDNSNEKYIADFSKDYQNVEYISSDNVGYGAGHNKAIKKALASGSRYHLVMNSDVKFSPEVLDRLVKYMDENKDVAQVQPNIIYPNGEMQYTCRLLPTPANLIFRRFLPKSFGKRLDDLYLLKDIDHTKPMNIAYHQGSFMFFRTECFKTVGLFDERFFMYPEDIDITRRMHKHYRTMFWPEVTVIHVHDAASYKNKKMLKIHTENMIKYFNKWGWFFDKERKEWNKQILKDYK